MNVRYRVELSQAERGELTAMLSKGKRAARKLKRAQILLAADADHSDEEIARAVEFHYTPKHASWLNMVEIEIGVLRGQCLDRRIDDPNWLRREIDAWERQRNAAGARIKWMFTTDKARAKMGRAYPVTSKES
jgi:hypothetical protein